MGAKELRTMSRKPAKKKAVKREGEEEEEEKSRSHRDGSRKKHVQNWQWLLGKRG